MHVVIRLEVIDAGDGNQTNSQQQSQQQPADENATVRAAERISETMLHRTLTKTEKEAAGAVVHYAFGTAVGAMYGAVAEVAPRTSAAWGLPFGTAVWLGADEIAVPRSDSRSHPSSIQRRLTRRHWRRIASGVRPDERSRAPPSVVDTRMKKATCARVSFCAERRRPNPADVSIRRRASASPPVLSGEPRQLLR